MPAVVGIRESVVDVAVVEVSRLSDVLPKGCHDNAMWEPPGSIIRGTKTLQPKAPTTQIWPIKPCPSHLSEGAWSRPGHFNKRVLPPHRF